MYRPETEHKTMNDAHKICDHRSVQDNFIDHKI